MFKNFDEIEKYVLDSKIVKIVALANAEDNHALEALVMAKRKGLVKGILIGNTSKIKDLLKSMNEEESDYEFIEEADELASAKIAVSLVKNHKADMPMKGLMMTSSFMKAILNKEEGLIKDGCILSQATVLEYTEKNRLMIISDCAVNIMPDANKKIKITENTIDLASKLGINRPNIAVLAPLEKVNTSIPSTVEAQIVASYEGYQNIGEIIGPVAMDIAMSKEAANHKNIDSPVCGNADILIMPDLASGNILTKGLVFIAHLKSAGVLLGTTSPVIMTSRTDTIEDKYLSILTSIYCSLK